MDIETMLQIAQKAAWKYQNDKELVEDYTQEIAMNLWEIREKIDSNQVPMKYARGAARNMVLDLLRKSQAAKRRVPGKAQSIDDTLTQPNSTDFTESILLRPALAEFLNTIPVSARDGALARFAGFTMSKKEAVALYRARSKYGYLLEDFR